MEIRVTKSETHEGYAWIKGIVTNPETLDDKFFGISGWFGDYDPNIFAAAPELMEALELALEYIQSCPDQLSASGQVAREAARAAIAKAKGETA